VLENSSVAERLLAPQEGLSSIELEEHLNVANTGEYFQIIRVPYFSRYK
jgi:hypothetical protein